MALSELSAKPDFIQLCCTDILGATYAFFKNLMYVKYHGSDNSSTEYFSDYTVYLFSVF